MRIILFLSAVVCLGAGCARESRPLPTVSRVELPRYAGRWFEIARLPNSFQRDDSRAQAEYRLLPDGTVEVRNTEFRPDGTRRIASGNAEAVASSGNARLRVKFSGLAALAPVPAEGNYWIIALEPDYSAALVGTPDRRFLWLLARRADLPEATRRRLIRRAAELGFPTERLLYADARR